MADKQQKHHYIPEFYLKQWAGPDGRLCEYSQPYDTVKAKMVHPGGTGYSRGLYTIKDAPPHLADVFENQFMSIADGLAAQSLRMMVNEHIVPAGEQKNAWTRFMLSLLYRTPEGVARSYEMVRKHYEGNDLAEIKKVYATIRKPSEPETVEEYLEKHGTLLTGRVLVQHLVDIIESDRVRTRLMEMQWHVGTMQGLKYPILTSDRPFVMTSGIAFPDSHFVMPLSPRHIFIAANSDEEVAKLKALARGGEIARRINDKMARQARKYVYGQNDSQLRFVANRLGQKAVCSPFE